MPRACSPRARVGGAGVMADPGCYQIQQTNKENDMSDTPTPTVVQISLRLANKKELHFDSKGSEGNVTAYDQCRVMMLGIYSLCQESIGRLPDDEVLEDLHAWAREAVS